MKVRRCLLALRWLLTLMLAFVPPADARGPTQPSSIGWVAIGDLPQQAQETLSRIRRGERMPYAKDGSVFFNRELRLPPQPRGYYTEYTVRTPGAHDRGGRRIIAGGNPRWSDEYYYTPDHYRSFRRIREAVR